MKTIDSKADLEEVCDEILRDLNDYLGSHHGFEIVQVLEHSNKVDPSKPGWLSVRVSYKGTISRYCNVMYNSTAGVARNYICQSLSDAAYGAKMIAEEHVKVAQDLRGWDQ